ncbi:MAG: hypothetical protein NZ480_01765, partial [Bdellovibrionaceae bacterium]|nr:hypothetical protein [Pseudobdellovibrionaceae bacterium]
KILGDYSLYVAGFFSESLQRKLVDIDYYVNMGRMAFLSLSDLTKIDTHGYVYRSLGQQFVKWVDVLNCVAEKSSLNSDAGLLRLYEKFLRTGSELALQKLLERGVVAVSQDELKKANQDVE